MKNYYIIIGNGFTIDLINNLNGDLRNKVDVTNLFKNGELVKWPADDTPGFLSFKHCPNLWTLGARHNLNSDYAMPLIEDVITCANVLSNNERSEPNIYWRAYKELVTYLKSLFIYYDSMVNISDDILNWGWAKFLKKVYSDPQIGKIHIVTFNYDVNLEKVLNFLGLKFSLSKFEPDIEKIIIYKPHGSISFSHKVKKDKSAFEIVYSMDSTDGKVSDFKLEYTDLNSLDSINAIIPPAGDSSRLDFKWAQEIRDSAKNIASILTENDEVIVCGLSYWHVDRFEIDSLLSQINANISDVKVINPNPSKVFNAIITTLFANVIFYNNSEPLIL